MSKRNKIVLDDPIVRFDWQKVLNQEGSTAAPCKAFFQTLTRLENRFQIEHHLAVRDPRFRENFVVAEVVQIARCWIEVKLVACSDSERMWFVCNSPELHPITKENREDVDETGCVPISQLQVPVRTQLDHDQALGKIRDELNKNLAPIEWFNQTTRNRNRGLFKVGQRLEAIDMAPESFSAEVFPATIAEIANDQLLIKFDDWGSWANVRVPLNSPDIFPCGWAEAAGVSVYAEDPTIPRKKRRGDRRSSIDGTAMTQTPSRRSTTNSRVSMQLNSNRGEAVVEKKNKQARVAHVASKSATPAASNERAAAVATPKAANGMPSALVALMSAASGMSNVTAAVVSSPGLPDVEPATVPTLNAFNDRAAAPVVAPIPAAAGLSNGTAADADPIKVKQEKVVKTESDQSLNENMPSTSGTVSVEPIEMEERPKDVKKEEEEKVEEDNGDVMIIEDDAVSIIEDPIRTGPIRFDWSLRDISRRFEVTARENNFDERAIQNALSFLIENEVNARFLLEPGNMERLCAADTQVVNRFTVEFVLKKMLQGL